MLRKGGKNTVRCRTKVLMQVAFLSVLVHVWVTASILSLEDFDQIPQASQHSTWEDNESHSLPAIPPSNITHHQCIVRFRDEKQVFCHNNSEESGWIVQKLLERHFNCSAAHIGFKDTSYYPETRFDRTCLWALESNAVDLCDGDHYWGSQEGLSGNIFAPNLTFHTVSEILNVRETLCSLLGEFKIQSDRYDCSLFEKTSSALLAINFINIFPYDLFQSVSHSNASVVIVLGNLRGGEKAWNSLYRHVLDLNNADLMLFTVGRTSVKQRKSSLYGRAKFIAEIPFFDDWANAIDIITHGNQEWRARVTRAVGKESILLGGALGHRLGSGALIFMARWFLRLYLREMNIHTLYERFVVTRSDHYYKCSHDFSDLIPVKNAIYVPNGQDWNGLCDRHFVCDQNHLYRALNLIEPLILHPERYTHYSTQAGWHPLQTTETFLKMRWQEDGLLQLVRRFARPMFTCAVDGDNFLWTPPFKDAIPEGVYVKYKLEYALAKSECIQSIVASKIDAALVSDDFKSPPKGVLIKGDTSSLNGWACDTDDPFSPTMVSALLINNLSGEVLTLEFLANQYGSGYMRKQCGGGKYHRFANPIFLPDHFRKAASLNQIVIQVFAVDLVDPNIRVELTHSPMFMKVVPNDTHTIL